MELKRRTLALTGCLSLWLLGSMPLALAQAATRLQQGIMRRPCRHRGRARDFDLAGAPLSAECRAVGLSGQHTAMATLPLTLVMIVYTGISLMVLAAPLVNDAP